MYDLGKSFPLGQRASDRRGHGLEWSPVEKEVIEREEAGVVSIPAEDDRIKHIKSVITDQKQFMIIDLWLGLSYVQRKSVGEISGILGITQTEVSASIRHGGEMMLEAARGPQESGS